MSMHTRRWQLVDQVSRETLFLGHHIENAAKAVVYARQGRHEAARWYGRQAREDLASYLNLRSLGVA